MSGLLPRRPAAAPMLGEHPRRIEDEPSREERRLRWEVRAAAWRAVALADDLFEGPVRSSLTAVRTHGGLRGLLRLDVCFHGLDDHREREARFLATAGSDPLLSRVPLVYVLGPDVV